MDILNGYLVDKNILVNFIVSDYLKLKGRKISPIKLQKSLYFLYIEWLKFISTSKSENQNVEIDTECQKQLFEPAFEAWPYGPVDSEIYHSYKSGVLNDFGDEINVEINAIGANDIVISFIEDLLRNEIYDMSDFRLVDISHSHDCWLKNKPGIISKEDMVEEFYMSNQY